MRALESSILIKRPTRRVWKSITSLGYCRTLTDSFWRFGRNLQYAVKHPQGSQAPDKQTLESGTRVTVTTGFNRPWIDWVVSDCVPGEFIVLRAERTGWLDGYHMVVRSDLETLDDEKCHLKVKLYVMFLNRGLEIASLFLPFGFLYSMCINSAIKKTKNSIERT